MDLKKTSYEICFKSKGEEMVYAIELALKRVREETRNETIEEVVKFIEDNSSGISCDGHTEELEKKIRELKEKGK